MLRKASSAALGQLQDDSAAATAIDINTSGFAGIFLLSVCLTNGPKLRFRYRIRDRRGILQKTVEAAGMLLLALETPPKFLLMRHRDRWDLPKGHAEEGEENLTTALRETEEETGIPSAAIAIDPDFSFVSEYLVTYRNRGECLKRVTFFLGYLPTVLPIVITEHESSQWWSWPQEESLQVKTIDPLLKAARVHFEKFPERLIC